MPHRLEESVEALLEPERLSKYVGQSVTQIARKPLSAEFAHSGSGLELVTTNHGSGPRAVLKRVSLQWDWLMRATGDRRCRAVTVWQYGLLDRLPPLFAPAVLACALDGEGWAILMPDYSAALVTNCAFSESQHRLFLDALAAMHAAFWNDPTVADPAVGLCSLLHVYRMFTPAVARREGAGAGEIPGRILEGWNLAHHVVGTDVMAIIAPLLEDPAPLCTALARFPQTLVHGDFRHSNLGVLPVRAGATDPGNRRRLALLDWQLAAAAPPVVELGRYLGANSPLLPASKEHTLEFYFTRLQHHLAAHGRAALSRGDWERQCLLGMLGGFLQDGWAIVLKAAHWRVGAAARRHWQADLNWWTAQVRNGATLLR